MKALWLILLLPLTGCNSLPKTVAALGADTNSIVIKIHSPWGSAEYYRNAKP